MAVPVRATGAASPYACSSRTSWYRRSCVGVNRGLGGHSRGIGHITRDQLVRRSPHRNRARLLLRAILVEHCFATEDAGILGRVKLEHHDGPPRLHITGRDRGAEQGRVRMVRVPQLQVNEDHGRLANSWMNRRSDPARGRASARLFRRGDARPFSMRSRRVTGRLSARARMAGEPSRIPDLWRATAAA